MIREEADIKTINKYFVNKRVISLSKREDTVPHGFLHKGRKFIIVGEDKKEVYLLENTYCLRSDSVYKHVISIKSWLFTLEQLKKIPMTRSRLEDDLNTWHVCGIFNYGMHYYFEDFINPSLDDFCR